MILHINSKEELQKAISENTNLIIDFFATWCGPCKMLAREIEEIEANKLAEHVVIAKVDVDENNDLAREFQVYSIPTLYFYKDGKQISYTYNKLSKPFLLGGVDKNTLLQIIDETF